jgi:hypothetical protein
LPFPKISSEDACGSERKKVGVASFASAAVPVVKSMLKQSGVELQSDTLLPVGVMDQAMAALNSGKVQALGLYDGCITRLSAPASNLGISIIRRWHHSEIPDCLHRTKR